MTYNELRESIKGDISSDDPIFLGQIDTFIRQAESFIWAAVRLPAFTSNAQIQLTANDPTSLTPINFLSVDYISIPGFGPLYKKTASFIREAYLPTDTGRPMYFALEDNYTILWGPTPDQDYQADMNYYNQPDSIIDQRDAETYTSIKFPVALLHGSLVFAYGFTRDYKGQEASMGMFDKALGLADGYTKGRFTKQDFQKNSAAVDSGELK